MTTATKHDERTISQLTAVKKELSQLVGGVITATDAIVEYDGFAIVWPVLRVTLANGEKLDIIVSQDEEGNGAGHLFIGAEGSLYEEV